MRIAIAQVCQPHGEVDFRDARRDHEQGRIWRIAAKNRPVLKKPKLVSAKNSDLLDQLLSPNGFNRAALKAMGRVPIAGGEHEFTLYGFRELLEAKAVDYIQFDTNRVGGITQARKIAALAEAYSVPVVPHAGQMHNYHVVMASFNSPMAEFFPVVDVEVGNELFWYVFKGEPTPVDGYIDLDENVPGLGLTIDEESLKRFEIIE